jgi:hypothetical protein
MTTLPNYPTPDELSFTRAERKAARGKDAVLAIPEDALERARGLHTHTIQQSRMLSAFSFFAAAGLAVFQIAPTFMLVFLAIAVLAALSAPLLALREFRLEIERTARDRGLPEDAARRVAAERTTAFRAKRAWSVFSEA